MAILSYAFSKAFEANHRHEDDWNTNEPVIKEIHDNTDKAQNLTFSGVWDLPLGHDAKRFLNVSNPAARLLVDNWRVTPILSYASGNPTGMANLINTCGG